MRKGMCFFSVGILLLQSIVIPVFGLEEADWPIVVLDMDVANHRPTTFGSDNQPIGSVEVVPGREGGACQFRFSQNAKSGFFTSGVSGTQQWDEAEGISFWVKGDGSSNWAGLELIDQFDYKLRYGYCFPLDSTEWRKITVPWCDLVPELPAGKPVDPQQGYSPSNFGNLWFGKWYYWGDYPAHSFAIDEISLERRITVDTTDYTPTAGGTPRLQNKLRNGQPVTVVTMGDSLSDKRHWANRDVLWSELLSDQLQKQFGCEVSLVNPAIGGTQLTQNLVLMPRWLRDHPHPDLVTLWFGFNDWDGGMRGEDFRRMLRFSVDRIRRMTRGRSEVLLVTTCPSFSRWDTMKELADAVRSVAAEKNTGLADVAAAFHEAGVERAARLALYCRDKTHLSAQGHDLAAKTILKAIVEEPTEIDGLDASAGEDRAASMAVASPFNESRRHPVPEEHPRLLGSRDRLQRLATERAEAYQRLKRVAQQANADAHSKMISMALVSAIEEDRSQARQAIDMAMQLVDGPVKKGHVPFGHDLARCAIVYDLCHEHWRPEEVRRFHQYMNDTVDANLHSEPHVFHNGWYGYKNWGIGLACYASYYENRRAAEILRSLESEFRTRAAPALQLAGDGGGWAEGYYVNYWLYEWLFFCEVARWCEGVDYYALAPAFFRHRAVAGMFETYPGIGIYNTRRSSPVGDGGGRLFGGDRDKALFARRILVNHFRDDPSHQAVHTFNEMTQRCGVGNYAYGDFLWRDSNVKRADLSRFRLSHYSPGPGYVHARSSWNEDATYFFFKCGDRFTAHQHLDVGHFLIYKNEELVGDGGHYDNFGSPHDVNYHLRSIAHNTILVRDASEEWPNIRAAKVLGNDGGQAHNWPHHNGAVADATAWSKNRSRYDIADIVAFSDFETHVYVAGDCTRAYSPTKLESFTRQIVFERPGTFVIFDRVVSQQPDFKKTWLLQAMKRPDKSEVGLVMKNGKGRLFVQTLLPADPNIELCCGEDLYRYEGHSFPPGRDTGPAPECRIEVSPPQPARVDYFLHVLTATDTAVESIQPAILEETDSEVRVRLHDANIVFDKNSTAGSIEIAGRRLLLKTH
jgi:lysophospholipase L1-like esterase